MATFAMSRPAWSWPSTIGANGLVTALAWRLPRWLAYWCAIRVAAHATTGRYGTTDPTRLSVTDMLKRWEP